MRKKFLNFFILIIGLLLLYYLFDILENRLTRLFIRKNLEYQEIKFKADQIWELQKLITYNNIKLNIIERVETQDPANVIKRDFLRRLSFYVPDNLYLRKITFDFKKKYLLISGTAIEKNTLDMFVDKLRHDEIAEYIKIKNLSRRLYKKARKIGYDFELYMKTL